MKILEILQKASEQAVGASFPAQRDSITISNIPVPAVSKDTNTCSGCFANWWKKAVDFGVGTFSVVQFAAQMTVGQKASDDVRELRESICRDCSLFTVVKEGIFSCGKPATQKLLRIRNEEGCGCWLNLKWLGPSEKCPMEPPKW